jgi:hypothetical protein
VRALFPLIILGTFAASAQAQSLEVIGYSGYLGEWELTATVTGMYRAEQRNIPGH